MKRIWTRITLILAITALVVAGGVGLISANLGSAGAATASAPPLVKTFDSQAVIDPLFRWTFGFDEEDEAMMRDAFTEDARFDFYLATGGDPLVFDGRDAIMDLFLGAIADQTPDEQRRHVTTNVRVEWVDRHTAVVTSYLSLMVAYHPEEPPTLLSTGVYTDRVVLERDGVWRIQHRELRLDTVT